jgi:hypothetical protein
MVIVLKMSAEEIGREYAALVASLTSRHPNIDPFLLIKSAMLNRKYPEDKEQRFWLEVYLKEGIDPDKKRDEIYSEIGVFGTGLGHNHFQVSLNAPLDTILRLANDVDVIRIEGEVFPFS